VAELPAEIDSRFRYVLLASKRAEQLIEGAQPKGRSKHTKATRIAMEELENGLVKWQLTAPAAPEPEELLLPELE
jgi:DNA-directed RNA polymerase omega subunit